LVRWRNAQVYLMRGRACVGGCPIGSLASELSDTDPLARARLTRAFAQWEDLIRDGLKAIAARGELPSGLDVDRLALAMLAGVQGGVQLSQVRRDTGPLEAAVDAMIDTSAAWGVR
jgi:TetR/AcrR family transcriptional repressor of nem operon